MFVGVGAARVRDLFEQARKHAPAIIFKPGASSTGSIPPAAWCFLPRRTGRRSSIRRCSVPGVSTAPEVLDDAVCGTVADCACAGKPTECRVMADVLCAMCRVP
jgi:hypothetical protein